MNTAERIVTADRTPRERRDMCDFYAAEKRARGTHSGADEGPLAEGWAAGYRAAVHDVRKAHSMGDVAVHKLVTDAERLR